MYLTHFRLNELPFSLTPDTAFFMSRAGYRDALNVLLVALRSGEGFVKVIGEVGTGKTILCRTLLKALGADFECAYLPNPYLRASSLLFSIADELRIDYPKRSTQHQLMKHLNAALLAFHAQGKRVVLCMDEAQAVPVQTLEILRLLTNLETEKRKLLQVVLFGQPELDAVLDQPSIRQLRQRITFGHELYPLNRADTAHYVNHRVAIAGYQGSRLFTQRALDDLQDGSRGVPRVVNILAHKALMAAFGHGVLQVDRTHVRDAIKDTADARSAQVSRGIGAPYRWLRWLAGSV
ncbi:MAG: AAA family ATPase [Gammaproteobacteria bacterium]|nr:AAA family ATPase [Gammaproteobacteria bacterium]